MCLPCSKLAKRAAELLASISPSKRQPEPPLVAHSTFHTSTPTRSPRPSLSFAQTLAHGGVAENIQKFHTRYPDAPQLHGQSHDILQQEAEWEAHDADYLAMAKTFIEAKEFLRVIHWLNPCRSSKAAFLRVYCQYLVNPLRLTFSGFIE